MRESSRVFHVGLTRCVRVLDLEGDGLEPLKSVTAFFLRDWDRLGVAVPDPHVHLH